MCLVYGCFYRQLLRWRLINPHTSWFGIDNNDGDDDHGDYDNDDYDDDDDNHELLEKVEYPISINSILILVTESSRRTR